MSKELDQHDAAAWSQRQRKHTRRKKAGPAAGKTPAKNEDFQATWAIRESSGSDDAVPEEAP